MSLTDKVVEFCGEVVSTIPLAVAVVYILGDSPKRPVENTPTLHSSTAIMDLPIGESCNVIGGYMTCDRYILRDDGSRQYIGQSPTRRVAGYNLNIL